MSREKEQYAVQASAATGFASGEAEKSLIGSIVMSYDKCAHVAAELVEDDFYFPENKAIFQAVRQAKAQGFTVDMVTIDTELRKMDVNADTVFDRLIDAVQSAEIWAVESHHRIVKELAARRRAIELVAQIGSDLKNPSSNINEVVEKLVESSGNLFVGGKKWVSMSDVMLNTYDFIEKRANGEIKSIATGIQNLDRVIGGFFGGELTIIGARPAVGKSVFGMNVALAAAANGYKVCIVSREMTDIQYGQRILSYAGGVDGSKIRNAKIETEDWEAITDGMVKASKLPISFMFSTRTVDDLRAEVQRKYNRGEIDMLVVDYLQLMESAQRFKEDRLRVGYISKALKDMSTDFDIPVIALAQVKRYAGGARAHMPTLEDLKDSGSIEQDADNVIFLHNPIDNEDEFVDPRDKEAFNSFAEQGYTYLCIGIAKQRQGVTGKCCVLFDKSKMRYFAIDRDGSQPPQMEG